MAIVSLLLLFYVAERAQAATGINEQINFQGKVVNTDGTNVTTASYTFLFCIYTTASPATACTSGANNDAIWRESKSITVTDGIFQTNLGDTTTLPGSVDFNTDNIYLGINFNANGQMTPLVRFTATPYALNAAKVSGLTVTDTTGTLTVPSGKTISFADAFTTSGAFATTLTSTGVTNATLPSGTITLVDLATSQSLTNKTIGSTGLTFSGATTDITTASGEDLTITAAGAGIISLSDATTIVGTTNINATGTAATTIGNATGTFALTSSGGLNVTTGGALTGVASIDTIATSATGLTFAGAGTIASTTTSALTLDSGTTGTVNLGTSNNAKTIAIGTGTAGNVITIGTNNTTSDTIAIGSALDNVAITGDQWSVTDAGVLTVVSCTGCGGGGATLDSAYTAGNTITTDSGNNIIFTLQDVVTPTSFVIENQDTAGVSAQRIFNSIASGTLTNGLLIEQTGAGTMTSGIQITETAGAITTGINIGNNIATGISIGTGATTGISVGSGGITITAGALAVNSDSITSDGALVINATSTDIQDAVTVDSLTADTGGVSIAAAQSYTGAGAVTLSSASASGLTLNSGTTGTIAIGDDASAETINIGTGAADKTTVVGSTNTTSGTTINSGSDGITLVANGTTISNAELVLLDGKTGTLIDDTDLTSGDGAGGTSTGSGMEAGTGGIGLLQGCSDGQVLKWTESTSVWGCAADSTGGGGAPDTSVFVDTAPAAWADNNTTELFNDATKPNITTDSAAATVMVSIHIRGTASNTANDAFLAARIVYTNDQTNPSCTTSTQVGEPMIGGFTTAATHPWQVSGTFIHTPSSTGEEIRYTVCTSTESTGTATDTPEDVRVSLVELGADLAENYYTSDNSIEPGDVVAVEGYLPAGVEKSQRAYDSRAIGVVSTTPGITLDDAIGFGQGRAVPVALVGRIPVKVSTENGRVKAGDYLTSSSTPGVAMKATKSGIVIGQALQDFSYAESETGLVMTFVKNGYFDGERITDENGTEMMGEALLQKMVMEKGQVESAVNISEIITDRILAGLEIVTPRVMTQELLVDTIRPSLTETLVVELGPSGELTIGEPGKEPTSRIDALGNATFAGIVTAKSIRAESIEGLEIFTGQISSLEDKYAGLAALTSAVAVSETSGSEKNISPASLPTDVAFKSLAADRVTVNLDAKMLGALSVDGGLVISGKARFQGESLFRKLVEFFGEVIFKGDVLFEKTPTFNSDTAGFAVITEGDQSVTVVFDEEYAHQPIVTATLTNDISPLSDEVSDKSVLADIEAVEKDFTDTYFDKDVRYIVTKKGAKSFTIVLNKKAPRDLQFSWIALAVKNSKTAYSHKEKEDISGAEESMIGTEIVRNVLESESTPQEVAPVQSLEPAIIMESVKSTEPLPVEADIVDKSVSDEAAPVLRETPQTDTEAGETL